MMFLIEVLIAFALDVLFGNPRILPHPVNLILWMGGLGERVSRKLVPKHLKIAGIFVVVAIVALVFFATWWLASLASLIRIYLVYAALSTRKLDDSAHDIAKALVAGDLSAARERLSGIVRRDTGVLSESGISAAVIENVARNTSNVVIAPLFWLFFGSLFGFGIPLMWTFVTARTLDSLVDHKNEKYRDFGWLSAHFNDVLSFLPARITGWLMVATSCLDKRFDERESAHILLRDHADNVYPNSAWGVAAMAGALGVKLGGGMTYEGISIDRPLVNREGREPIPADIGLSTRLMWRSSLGFVIIVTLGSLVFERIL